MATAIPDGDYEARRDAHAASGAAVRGRLADWLKLVAGAVLLALVVRTLVVQPFRIPSGSMAPALEAGDVILVDKTAYGWSRAALPIDPLRDRLPGEPLLGWPMGPLDRLLARLPERVGARPVRRGDVILFLAADGSRRDYVKRAVAVGGDRVALAAGRVIVNGSALPCLPAGEPVCRETGPDGRSWMVRESGRTARASMAPVTVPPGHYFVLGDDRDGSADSRLPLTDGGMGMVADRQLVGKARAIMISAGPGGIRWARTGTPVG